MKPQVIQSVAHEEAVLAIIVQLIGMFLILSSTVMFVKQESLQKVEHLQQINILLCSTIFLIIDWILVLPGNWPCDMFSVVFIVFGSVSTFSTVGIAFGRYKKMIGFSFPVSDKLWIIIELLIVWFASLLIIAYPVWQKVTLFAKQSSLPGNNSVEYSPTSDKIQIDICFFQDNFLYINYYMSIIFMSGSVVLPVGFIIFFYIKIFKRIRQARLSSWLNHMALQRSRQAQVIQCAGRKANVFQLTSSHPDNQNAHRFNSISSKREKSVFLKGLFAVAVVMICWMPFASLWLYLSIVGFQWKYIIYVRYLVINAKLSVILNIGHYICFNVKYRNLYIQTVFGPFTNFLNTLYTESQEVTCVIDSQIATCPKSSGFDKSVFTTRHSRTLLEPIQESQQKETDELHQNILKRDENTKTITIQRALPLPQRLTANCVSPVENILSHSVS